MLFAQPHFLWLLLLLPVVAGWVWRRKRAGAIRHPAIRPLVGSLKGRARQIEALRLGLRLAILTLLIIGLSRPRWPDEGTRIPAQSVAIQMVLDISGSMAEQDFLLDGKPVSRLDAAKYAFKLFVEGGPSEPRFLGETGFLQEGLAGRGEDLVGVLTFSARSEDVCPPTLSHVAVLRMLAKAEPQGLPPDSSTNIGDAILEGLELLQRAKPREKVIVLLSDGEHNVPAEVVPNARKPRQSAQVARGFGIRVHTIFVGPNPESQTPSEAEQALQDVAAMTGGKSFRAHDTQALVNVCRDIDQLERTRIESFQYYRYHEAYPWAGLACIVLMIGAVILEGTRWRRAP